MTQRGWRPRRDGPSSARPPPRQRRHARPGPHAARRAGGALARWRDLVRDAAARAADAARDARADGLKRRAPRASARSS